MNEADQTEQPADSRDVRAARTVSDRSEPEPPSAKDSADFREVPEGGYGWGV